MNLPYWRASRIVQAGRIDGMLPAALGGRLLVVCGMEISVDLGWVIVNDPYIGGFLVVDPDGFRYYVPADQFEREFVKTFIG